ncbi:MAG: hypothetical protein LUQ07_03715 [Methanospirillum sp.]|nr:hypothetical protein [Methanospirillum sp.]
MVTLLILLISFLPMTGVSAGTHDTPAPSLVLTQPSDNETNFAEKRDFYVYGVFPDRLEHPGDIRIELLKEDNGSERRVRLLESHVDSMNGTTSPDSIETNYSEGLDRGDLMVADLIKEPGGLFDPSNKVVVTHEYYQGMILGGVTKDFDTTYRDENGTLLEDLTAGTYTIIVTGLSGDVSGQVVVKNITFGLTDSLFGTDRPPVNLQNRIAYADVHHLRIDRDWFPGYFLFPGYNNTGYSVPKRWNPNNAIESVNDQNGTVIDTPAVANNSLILYNINEKSTTYGVELSAILKYGLEESDNTTFLLYNTGEPSLSYINASSGTEEQVPGNLTPFPDGSRLALTRAEIYPDENSGENTYDPWNNTTVMDVDYHISDGITIHAGDTMTLFGVTKPIRSSVNETDIPHRFTINNRIATIRYDIRDEEGDEVYNSTRMVNLSRLFNQGSPDRFNSIFEFGHEFTLPDTPGRYILHACGIDMSGNLVSGTDNSVQVTVVAP